MKVSSKVKCFPVNSWNSLKDVGFPLSAANGLEIPYIGVAVVNLQVFGHSLSDVGILIVKEINGKNSEGNPKAILGTNVLSRIPNWSLNQKDVVVCNKQTIEDDKCTLVRFSSSENVLIPSHTAVNVRVHTNNQVGVRVIEPLSYPIVGNLLVLTTLVNFEEDETYIKVINQSDKDVWLKPGTRLAKSHAVQEVECNGQFVNLKVSTESIVVEKDSKTVEDTVTVGTDDLIKTLDVDLSNITDSQYLEQTRKLLKKHSYVFLGKEDPIGCTHSIKHVINTTDDIPISQPYRRIPPHLIEEVRDHLNDLLKKGIITESESAYAAPIVLVRKKSGELRICNDYRKLNTKVARDAFPLPRIEESLESLGKAKIFSTLDLASAYNQIEVDEKDRHKTAFTTPFGLFEQIRMPFGIANAPSTFQRLMTNIFRNEILDFLIVYLDDIIIYSETMEEHLENLDLVFTKLKQHGLKLKASKCSLFKKEIKYLGHVLSADGLATDPEKTVVVKNWVRPHHLKELRRFLGFSSYYRRFIPNFSNIAAPLHALVGILSRQNKGKKMVIGDYWKEEHERAFNSLKEKLTTTPILAYPDFTQPFILETDASINGFGAVLSQKQGNQLRVIAYASRGLRENERKSDNFGSMKLELMALVWAISDKFREYLQMGSFIVLTDNNPLTYFM